MDSGARTNSNHHSEGGLPGEKGNQKKCSNKEKFGPFADLLNDKHTEEGDKPFDWNHVQRKVYWMREKNRDGMKFVQEKVEEARNQFNARAKQAMNQSGLSGDEARAFDEAAIEDVVQVRPSTLFWLLLPGRRAVNHG